MFLKRKALLATFCATGLLTAACGGGGESGDKEYFAGKTIQVLVAGNPGGGVDLNARLVGDFLSKHLPGKPRIKYTAMLGGAGIQIGNTLMTAKGDGLTVGVPGRGIPSYQVAGLPGIEFDSAKLKWIGGLGDDDNVIYVTSKTGVKTADDLADRAEPIVFGAGPRSNVGFVVPELLRTDAAWNIKIVEGLGSTTDSFLAVERGDVQASYETYQALVSAKKDWLDDGFITMVARNGTYRKELDGLPQVLDLLPPEAAETIGMLQLGWGAPMAAPPSTSAKVMKMYDDAMKAMVKDPEFAAEAKKRGVTTKLVTGAECLEIVKRVLATPPEVVDRYKKIVAE